MRVCRIILGLRYCLYRKRVLGNEFEATGTDLASRQKFGIVTGKHDNVSFSCNRVLELNDHRSCAVQKQKDFDDTQDTRVTFRTNATMRACHDARIQCLYVAFSCAHPRIRGTELHPPTKPCPTCYGSLIKWNAYLWSHWLASVHVGRFEGSRRWLVGRKKKKRNRKKKKQPRKQRPRRVWLCRQALQISIAHSMSRLPTHAF